MSRLRFETDRALFEAFPTARRHIGSEPTDEDPIRVMQRMRARGALEDALSFCAYLLPRREAVAWGCRSVRTLAAEGPSVVPPALRAAEAWVDDPGEERRRTAGALAAQADRDDPATWLARAAAWSGGTLAPAGPKPVPPPPHLTAVAVRLALLLALRRVAPEQRAARAGLCLDEGARLAESGL